MFKDSSSKSQKIDKLSAKRFCPFTEIGIIGKIVLKLELPSYVEMHDVVNMMDTFPYKSQLNDISAPVTPRPDPLPSFEGEECQIDRILNHRRKGRGFQFLTLMKGFPTHDAE